MRIVLIGPPGSGKGTQAEKLSKELDTPHISAGDLLREVEKKDTPLGRLVKGYLERGELVPLDITIKLLREKLEGLNRFILDGFPRSLEQAKALEGITSVDAAVELVVRDEVSVARISSRRVCENCHANFNLLTKPPREEGVCDYCGGRLVQREDAKPGVVKERLRIYHRVTEPVINHYKERGVLVRVNGELSEEEVFKEILNGLRIIARGKR